MQPLRQETDLSYPTQETTADAFADGCGRIPNNPVIAAVVAAVFKGGPLARTKMGGWVMTTDGQLVYRHLGRRGGYIQVSVEVAKPLRAEPAVSWIQRQWAFVESLSALTADTALSVLAELGSAEFADKCKFPLLMPVAISPDVVLHHKGYRRWGPEREAFKRRIAAEIEQLGKLRIEIRDFACWDPQIGRWNARGVSVDDDRLFELVGEGASTAGSRFAPRTAGGVVVRYGRWSRWWMNAQAKVWLTDLPQHLIRLDHRANRATQVLEKKIGLSIVLLLAALRAQPTIERRIDRLLEDVGELPRADCRGVHWAGRTRDRFEEALLHLLETGVIGPIAWPEGLAPGEASRSKGWCDRWLSAKLRIARPADGAAGAHHASGCRRPARRRQAPPHTVIRFSKRQA